ncbi:MAG: protoporphyrinogen oxidase [Verrucomicrobia bacterium]|nr:MAG: protoporphyrinogen oxidase [Verrucomicrobiota bacterium]
MKPVAIIGAGITGLTAAFYLKRNGIPVRVYESSGRVGGVIQSIRSNGFLAEFGPNTILETSPKIGQLIRDTGLEGRRMDPNPKAEARYLVRKQRPVRMPDSPLGFFTTSLFSAKAKLALLREPFVPARNNGKEESIAEFVTRRLGREFLDQAIDALVAGVYAGDPARLSVKHAFPRLEKLEARYGSLIKGQILGARERKRSGEISKDRAPKFSFDEGLQVLPETLHRLLGDSVRLNTPVTRLTQTRDGWLLSPEQSRDREGAPRAAPSAHHSAILYAGTAFALAELEINLVPYGAAPGSLGAHPTSTIHHPSSTIQYPPSSIQYPASIISPLNLGPLSEIRYPPVASVVLGFRREDVAHPCEGFGVLIPKIEGFKILGTIFSSSLFPNRAPAGHLLLTSYVGGERYPELASLPTDKLVELTCRDLERLLGVRGKPVFQHTAFFPKAIPQYNVGYGRFRELMTQIEQNAPGLFLAGHYRDGVSLSDSIVSGCNAADRVTAFVKTTDEHG